MTREMMAHRVIKQRAPNGALRRERIYVRHIVLQTSHKAPGAKRCIKPPTKTRRIPLILTWGHKAQSAKRCIKTMSQRYRSR